MHRPSPTGPAKIPEAYVTVFGQSTARTNKRNELSTSVVAVLSPRLTQHAGRKAKQIFDYRANSSILLNSMTRQTLLIFL